MKAHMVAKDQPDATVSALDELLRKTVKHVYVLCVLRHVGACWVCVMSKGGRRVRCTAVVFEG